MLDVVEDNI